MKILELFSGIGGMHFAFAESQIDGEVIAAIDINTNANLVYKHNFPKTPNLSKNIQSLTADFINNLNVDTILMSPPCQPFTRNGLKKDIEDKRSIAFLHLLDILPELNLENILIENVKGFEKSDMRNLLVQQLERSGYIFQEFILSPHQFGVPNTRYRYYCLAKKMPKKFYFNAGQIKEDTELFKGGAQLFPLLQIMENGAHPSYLLPDSILRKHAKIVDICFPHSTRSCCFTKAYGRYIEGTGSVITQETPEYIAEIYQNIGLVDPNSDAYLENLRKLNLRFFTPIEVSRLMSFPEQFTFPDTISNKQKYMLLVYSFSRAFCFHKTGGVICCVGRC